MGLRGWNVAVLAAAGALWLVSGTQRERAVMATVTPEMGALEDEVAAKPGDAAAAKRLAQAYLDAQAPGLALAVIGRAPLHVRENPSVGHVYARALRDQGRALEALAAERQVLDGCAATESACDASLIASATRRSEILEQLVQLGVEDAQAHPEASVVAYHNATREARLALE